MTDSTLKPATMASARAWAQGVPAVTMGAPELLLAMEVFKERSQEKMIAA